MIRQMVYRRSRGLFSRVLEGFISGGYMAFLPPLIRRELFFVKPDSISDSNIIYKWVSNGNSLCLRVLFFLLTKSLLYNKIYI